ncbi:energy-coupling factor ABC transporter ATP-binding protein [Streptococcus caprae]|uniref:Energy-coupling factor ABC transporter ATP-binding protein n=1 Tax=Streptococcus caprae TaxID=1640501 RepID=A0ABV8CV36_9STRE
MTNMIDVSNLYFKYDSEQPAYTLEDVTFHVKHGEWLSIIGHNGSGKSTTVRLIDGLLAAESGQIVVGGITLSPDTVWDVRQKIGMVFQNPDNQFVGATVEDDVAFGMENKGVSHAEMAERVKDALELVGMTEFMTREPARLSGGQKQRVAIAGAVAMRPEVIILDEATSMLDPEGRLELIKTMQAIRERYGMTIVSITHDLDEVALSDRVLVMKQGKIVSDVTPRQLFSEEDHLLDLGLESPFTSKVIDKLAEYGLTFSANYLTEKELENELWALLSNR